MHRAHTLSGTLGLTTLGTLLPGSGILLAGRRTLGLVLLGLSVAVAVLAGYAVTHASALLSAAVDPDTLTAIAAVALTILVGLVAVAVVTYRMVRRPWAPRGERWVEGAFLVVLCLLVAAPFAVGARYAFIQRDLVSTVFVDQPHTTVEGESVWGADHRVNVLLLGGDGGVHRIGIRTDTVMLASIDTDTGDTTLFSLPRNLQAVPFPPGSPLDQAYPHGFTGPGDPLEWMLNAVYRNVPQQHPHLLDGAENEGATAVEQAVSGALGIPVDYYVLVNLRGFREVVDAIGGITVNINQPIPIGGNTDLGIPPDDYLQPGPDQHLDGFEALWFARGRYGLDDYNRMERQRCVVDALIDEVDPITLLRRYEALADAGKKVVRTDIPQDLVPSFVRLTSHLREGEVDSVVFRASERFDPNDPDYDYVRRVVQRHLPAERERQSPSASARATGSPGGDAGASASAEPSPPAGPTASGSTAETDGPCGYHPVG